MNQRIEVTYNLAGAIQLLDLVSDYVKHQDASEIRQLMRAGTVENAFKIFESTFNVEIVAKGRYSRRKYLRTDL